MVLYRYFTKREATGKVNLRVKRIDRRPLRCTGFHLKVKKIDRRPAASNTYTAQKMKELRQSYCRTCNFCQKKFVNFRDVQVHVAHNCNALPVTKRQECVEETSNSKKVRRVIRKPRLLTARQIDTPGVPVTNFRIFTAKLKQMQKDGYLSSRVMVGAYDTFFINVNPNYKKKEKFFFSSSFDKKAAGAIKRRSSFRALFQRQHAKQNVDYVIFPVFFWCNETSLKNQVQGLNHSSIVIVNMRGGEGKKNAYYLDSYNGTEKFERIIKDNDRLQKNLGHALGLPNGIKLHFPKTYPNVVNRACVAMSAFWMLMSMREDFSITETRYPIPKSDAIIRGLKERLLNLSLRVKRT